MKRSYAARQASLNGRTSSPTHIFVGERGTIPTLEYAKLT